MKRTRTILLATMLVIALFVAVLPAFGHFFDELNWSFMGDKDADGDPDKWNVKGDVFRVCDHPYTSYTADACMMVFPPSNRAAAVWQRVTDLDAMPVYPSWIVVTEEGSNEFIGEFYGASKALDSYRAYYGVRLTFSDGVTVLYYDEVPGGHNHFSTYLFYDIVELEGLAYDLDDLAQVTYGVLAGPGNGYLAVDYIIPEHP